MFVPMTIHMYPLISVAGPILKKTAEIQKLRSEKAQKEAEAEIAEWNSHGLRKSH